MSVRAADAGFLLQSLVRGGVVEVGPDQEPVLARLRDAGLVRPAADPGPERALLAELQAELTALRTPTGGRGASPRERALRTSILELSERLAESEGAAEVRTSGTGGPYRGAASTAGARYQVTQKGRALLSDLAPRMLRVGTSTLDAFGSEMHALRVAIAWRADRAAEIARLLAPAAPQLGRESRSIAIGLSAARGEPARIVSAFSSALRAMGRSSFSVPQDASAAESLCLADLEAAERASSAQDVGTAELRSRGEWISLPLALLATAGEDALPPHVAPTILAAAQSLVTDLPAPQERIAVAVLLAFARGDLVSHLERWRVLRQYLARFAPDGMAIAAALLTWIALEPSETLDDLRLVAAEIQKRRLADGGAETMSLAIKLLVSIAMLAAGDEGDHEEKLALAPIATPRAPHVGLHGALAQLPLVTTALAAFHRPVLDAALEYERVYQSTHSAYVFSGAGWG